MARPNALRYDQIPFQPLARPCRPVERTIDTFEAHATRQLGRPPKDGDVVTWKGETFVAYFLGD